MITETADRNELLQAVDEPVQGLLDLAAGLSDDQLNEIPYPDSWTAGQLLQHVTKSISGIAQAMQAEAKPAARNPTEKVAGLRDAFLDYSRKMKSPDFIVPEPGPYQNGAVMEALRAATAKLKENAGQADPAGMVEGLPFGPVTKQELLHFVVYHTTRHLHQLHQICDALQEA